MLNLFRPKVLDRISRNKAMVVSTDYNHFTGFIVSKKRRPIWWEAFHEAVRSPETQAFIFDSGQDNPPEEIQAFQETAEERESEDLFHLPYRTVWIEDYFSDSPDSTRVCYLCHECEDGIGCWSVVINPEEDHMHVLGVFRWLRDQHMFGYRIPPEATARWPEEDRRVYQRSSMATLMLQKFIGTLAASNTVRERGETSRREVRKGRNPCSQRSKDFRTVIYPYTHVSPPPDETVQAGEDGRQPRRRHLVRGYTWGRTTRPKDQQRRIQPYWRGQGEVIEARQHYEIRS